MKKFLFLTLLLALTVITGIRADKAEAVDYGQATVEFFNNNVNEGITVYYYWTKSGGTQIINTSVFVPANSSRIVSTVDPTGKNPPYTLTWNTICSDPSVSGSFAGILRDEPPDRFFLYDAPDQNVTCPKPTNLNASCNNGHFNFSWTAGPTATNYAIRIKNTATGIEEVTGDAGIIGNVLSYTYNTPALGTTYNWWLHGINAYGWSSPATNGPNVFCPAPPIPIGNHDDATCTSTWGWTCDADNYTTALDVHLYVDGPAGVGTGYNIGPANVPREVGVANACGGNANHGFSWNIPASLKNGAQHSIYAYAIDPQGVSNPLLGGSPKYITCAAPPTPTLTPTPLPKQVEVKVIIDNVIEDGKFNAGESFGTPNVNFTSSIATINRNSSTGQLDVTSLFSNTGLMGPLSVTGSNYQYQVIPAAGWQLTKYSSNKNLSGSPICNANTTCDYSSGWTRTYSPAAGETVTYFLGIKPILTPTPTPTCAAGQFNPHSACSGSSCVSIAGCGVSSCTTSPNSCAINSPTPTPTCAAGRFNPHNVCSGSSCVSIAGCGVSSCTGDSQCTTPTSNVSGRLFIDYNGDGIFNNADTYYSGSGTATVSLINDFGNVTITPDQTLNSSNSFNYSYTGLTSQHYKLYLLTAPSGYSPSTAFYSVDFPPSSVTQDVGMLPPTHAISGTIFIDNGAGGGIANDGIKQVGEGVYDPAGSPDTVSMAINGGASSIRTLTGGNYALSGFAENSDHTLNLTPPSGYVYSYTGANPNYVNPRTVTVTTSDVAGINFGIIPDPGFAISGNVFIDSDSDCVLDPGEPNHSGATINRSGLSTNLGYDGIGGSINGAANRMRVSRLTALNAAQTLSISQVTQGKAYLRGGTIDGTVYMVIYNDSAGLPGNLLNVSNGISIAAGRGPQWDTFTFPAFAAVPSSTLWLGIYVDTTGTTGGTTGPQINYSSSVVGNYANTQYLYRNVGDAPVPSPFGAASQSLAQGSWSAYLIIPQPSASLTSISGSPGYSFTTLSAGTYDITLTVPNGYTLSPLCANPISKTIPPGATGVDFGLRPNSYSISGNVFIDNGAGGPACPGPTCQANDGVKNGTEANYTGGGVGFGPLVGSMDYITGSGTFTLSNLAGNSTYDITLIPPPGYIISKGGANPNFNPRSVQVTTADVFNQNFGIISQPIYTIDWNCMVDNPPTGTIGANDISINDDCTISYSKPSDPTVSGTKTSTGGVFPPVEVPAGEYSITIVGSSIPPGLEISYPTSPYTVTVGPACDVSGAASGFGATCVTSGTDPVPGSIEGLSFGFVPPGPWIQSSGADIRFDNGLPGHDITIPISAETGGIGTNTPSGSGPGSTSGGGGGSGIGNDIVCNTTGVGTSGSNYISTNGNGGAGSPGIIYAGDSPADFGNGSASSPNWEVGLPSTDIYTPSNGVCTTSYAYVSGRVTQGGITPTNPCADLNNCTILPSLASNAYKIDTSANGGNVTLTSATIGDGKKYIFLIKGNLIIKTNIIVPRTSTVTFIVSGDIHIDKNLGTDWNKADTQIEGFYSADGSFYLDGEQNNCLTPDKRINMAGSIIVNAGGANDGINGDFVNNRTLCTNNTFCPVFTISDRPDFILNAPESIKQIKTIYQEVAP